jgi:hypothetical protein
LLSILLPFNILKLKLKLKNRKKKKLDKYNDFRFFFFKMISPINLQPSIVKLLSLSLKKLKLKYNLIF